MLNQKLLTLTHTIGDLTIRSTQKLSDGQTTGYGICSSITNSKGDILTVITGSHGSLIDSQFVLDELNSYIRWN